ncbi:MAG TPA: hypothetical protein VMI94_07465 [Bryobacteraceae bacterium]|nr:hypothetical protein [Bryobacteraceae bacterium]
MEPFAFDERYIAGLQKRDPAIESHFVACFKLPVWNIAMPRLSSRDLAEDAVQKTLEGVLRFFRSGNGMKHPDRLPAFVVAVCRQITREMRHDLDRNRLVDGQI